jgi:hypothetical protein
MIDPAGIPALIDAIATFTTLSDEERAAIIAAAGRAGLPVTQWAREVLLHASAEPNAARRE